MNQLSNNKFLAYVRVSSKDQSRGTSLQEQKFHIETYTRNKGFVIEQFYGEVESASKTGRQIFDDMIKHLKRDQLRGIIFHKIDRSARNPKDQALLYDLMKEGYELHFVSESISTDNSIGRNMMYIMWGMASGYSENLRSEINKGISGRLKQGKLPLPPYLGYTNGPDCTKLIDPNKGPLVKLLFEEYSTGIYSLKELRKRSREIGLLNKTGKYLDKNALDKILRNPFYYGIIQHKRGIFQGEHEPLISKTLFDKVQYVLSERGFKKKMRFDYIFNRLLRCSTCDRKLKAMTSKKSYKYYFCRDWKCGVGCIAEPLLEEQFLEQLGDLAFTEEESTMFKSALLHFRKMTGESRAERVRIIDLEITSNEARLSTMLQKYIEQKIDDETYTAARKALLNKQIELKEQRNAVEKADEQALTDMQELGKLLNNPCKAYKIADPMNKRRLVISMMDKLSLDGKRLSVIWKKRFAVVANREKLGIGGDGGSRTLV